MSSYIKKLRNKETGKIVEAIFYDNYFGVHRYGVLLEIDKTVFGEDHIYSIYENVE
jgi:hypothetical protein